MTKVSGCIVTYQCYDKCREAIRSLFEHTRGVDFTLYIVDNASGDDTLARLKAEFPAIVPVQLPDNRGFGHGHNAVLPLLTSEFHFVINPDITLDADVISVLCRYFEQHPDTALITPEIRYPGGEVQVLGKRNPSFLALVGRHIFKKSLRKIVEHYEMLDEDLTRPLDVEFATGCFFGIRTEVFRAIGGFDERWFTYYEDMDITRRAREKGRAIFDPETYVYHAWERSSSHHLKYFLILIQGMFKYFGKWGFQLK